MRVPEGMPPVADEVANRDPTCGTIQINVSRVERTHLRSRMEFCVCGFVDLRSLGHMPFLARGIADILKRSDT